MPVASSSSRVSSSEKRRSGVADLRQSARQPQPMQPEARILARGQHHPQLRGQPGQEELEQPQRFRRAQLVQIVDHQYDRLLERVQVGQQPLDNRLAVEGRRGADPLHQPGLADRGGELVDDRQPEALRIALVTLDRHPGNPIGQPLGLEPGPQQHGLAAAGGRACEDRPRLAGRPTAARTAAGVAPARAQPAGGPGSGVAQARPRRRYARLRCAGVGLSGSTTRLRRVLTARYARGPRATVSAAGPATTVVRPASDRYLTRMPASR